MPLKVFVNVHRIAFKSLRTLILWQNHIKFAQYAAYKPFWPQDPRALYSKLVVEHLAREVNESSEDSEFAFIQAGYTSNVQIFK